MLLQNRPLQLLAIPALLLTGMALVPTPASPQVRARPQAAEPQTPSSQLGTSDATRRAGMFLKIQGIDGESTDRGHEGWIEVVSWSWGATGSANRQAEPADPDSGTLTVVRRADKASARLTEACTSGKSLGQVVVHVRSLRSGGGFDEYIVDDARTRSCTASSDAGRPTETISLNYARVEASAGPRDSRDSGDPDRPVVTGR